MNKLTFDLVGMKYRNLPTGFLQNLVGSSISLATDPTNPVDEHAVRCYYIGRHFAYVERGKSKPVTELLKTFKPYSINILSTQNNSITVEISIDEWAALSSNEVG